MDKKQEIDKKPCPYLVEVEDGCGNSNGFYCLAGGAIEDIMNHAEDVACVRRNFYEKIPQNEQRR